MSDVKQFDYLLIDSNQVAMVIRERLMPVQGKDAPIFPPTFAGPEGEKDKKPSYVIDEVGGELGKVAIIDTLGSQANRIEPLFKESPYAELVPQIEIQIGNRKVNLLDAGHRAGDAIVRFSKAGPDFHKAFATYRETGNSEALAKLSPTSLVFGVWDSRGSQAKFPRMVSSTIRATNVSPLTRAAQFFSSIPKAEAEAIESDSDYRSKEGYNDAPARSHGGVMVGGEILRDAVLNLIPLRSLEAGSPEKTLALQRYLLGICLIAFSAPARLYLREGCLLTADAEQAAAIEIVTRSGKRTPIQLDANVALEYARVAAAAFGVGPNLLTDFEAERAKKPAGEKPSKAKKL